MRPRPPRRCRPARSARRSSATRTGCASRCQSSTPTTTSIASSKSSAAAARPRLCRVRRRAEESAGMPRDFGCLLALALATAPAVGAGAAQPSALSGQRAPVTFTSDIAPLLYERCGVCHHTGGPAPFGLVTYQDAKQRARQIAAVTRDRVMPPWRSEPGYGEFVGHRPLSDAEIARIQQWVSDGTVEGDA